MRTTVNLDESVVEKARKLFGSLKTSELIDKALREMVQREAARRLADLGGSAPGASAPKRLSA
ncbi:type II toxin-antitoxin system VapB family antitoxin [Roseibacillus ishigakijimensis]|uniref:Type II toxin-antitoxin system VapB family antitoxin n=1 Tax=Roseibacillus ishigakijimensis TaxID=454146 RepID=A0A934VLX9_9BACT|nr:type II toxin-antitoxin system VapB family antitoxin [Roseibacillus ishigakijimensis]MBK1835159.1 type II toxin-antitoxin system VapB family antitoxin [Roseibacillus ishigakijimensis]